MKRQWQPSSEVVVVLGPGWVAVTVWTELPGLGPFLEGRTCGASAFPWGRCELSSHRDRNQRPSRVYGAWQLEGQGCGGKQAVGLGVRSGICFGTLEKLLTCFRHPHEEVEWPVMDKTGQRWNLGCQHQALHAPHALPLRPALSPGGAPLKSALCLPRTARGALGVPAHRLRGTPAPAPHLRGG